MLCNAQKSLTRKNITFKKSRDLESFVIMKIFIKYFLNVFVDLNLGTFKIKKMKHQSE